MARRGSSKARRTHCPFPISGKGRPAWVNSFEGMDLPVRVDKSETRRLASGVGERGKGRDVVFRPWERESGGAVVSDVRLIRGDKGLPAEPGHMTLVRDGVPCPAETGVRGTVCGFTGITDAVGTSRL